MRKIILLAAGLLCAGCTEEDWSYVVPGAKDGAYPADAAPASPSVSAAANYAAYAASPTVNSSVVEKCSRVARERKVDAERQGFDEDVQQHVYDATYADCLHWSPFTR